jgi:hypothetical protein
VPRLIRWTPAAAAAATAALLTVNWVRPPRPKADQSPGDLNPPAAALAARERTDWKFEVVADLIAGRLTASEAHAQFLDANRADPQALEYLRAALPGDTDEERTAYQLVLFVRVFQHPRAPEIAAAVSRQLLGRELPPGRPTAAAQKSDGATR